MIRMAGVAWALALTPAPASAVVILQPNGNVQPPCYSDSPACDRSVSAPLRDGRETSSLPDPAVAAIVGLAIIGVALGRRRSGMPEVVS